MIADMKVKANLILVFASRVVFAVGSDWSRQDSQRSESGVGVRELRPGQTCHYLAIFNIQLFSCEQQL